MAIGKNLLWRAMPGCMQFSRNPLGCHGSSLTLNAGRSFIVQDTRPLLILPRLLDSSLAVLLLLDEAVARHVVANNEQGSSRDSPAPTVFTDVILSEMAVFQQQQQHYTCFPLREKGTASRLGLPEHLRDG